MVDHDPKQAERHALLRVRGLPETGGDLPTAALAEEINAAIGRRQVDTIDIGGGLPVNFDSEEVTPTFADYAGLLRERVPALFSGEYRVRTEFGRTIFAKNGFIVSRVEYTKQSGGRHIATGHAGGQVATRTVFMPEHWKIRLSALLSFSIRSLACLSAASFS